jgi:hypothetical protein
MAKIIKPFIQGDLDSLCGLYSLTNIVHYLVGPLSQRQAEELIALMFGLLDKRGLALNAFQEGLGLNSIAFLIKKVLFDKYKITYSKPFHKGRYPTIGGVARSFREITLSQDYIALIAIEGVYSHWVPITKVTAKNLICFDSSDLKRLPIAQLSTNELSSKPHILYPRHCYIFSKL